jgi:anti-anti-sigma factor
MASRVHLPAGHGGRRAVASFAGVRAAAVAVICSIVLTGIVTALHAWYPRGGFGFVFLPLVAILAYRGGRVPGLLGCAFGVGWMWYVLSGARLTPPAAAAVLVSFAASCVWAVEAMVRYREQVRRTRTAAAIVASSEDAIYSKSLDGAIQSWNAAAQRLYGYTAEEAIGHGVTLLVPPERMDDERDILARLSRGERVERYETERLRKDGSRFEAQLTISPIHDDAGRVVAASSITQDITERRRAEREQQFLIKASDLFASALSLDGLLEALAALVVPELADWCSIDLAQESGALETVAVMHRDAAKVEQVRDLARRLAGDPKAEEARRRILATHRTELFEVIPDEALAQAVRDPEILAAARGLGLRSAITVALVARGRGLGVLSLATAESARRYSEADRPFVEQLAQRAALAVDNLRLHEAETDARRAAERVADRIGRLQAFTAALAEALTLEQVAEVTLDHIVAAFGAGAVALGLRDDESGEIHAIAARGYPPELTRRFLGEIGQLQSVGEAMRTGRVVWFPSWAAFQDRYPAAIPPVETLREGARAAVPLMLRDHAVGAFYMNFVDVRRFGPEELAFMLTFGRQCAQAIERARLYTREHQVASTLQQALLPGALHEIPGVRVDGEYMPASRASDVGGDWYDVFRLPDGRLCIAIGDVVGHGLDAAVIMGQMRQAVRTAALEGHEPARVLQLASSVLRLNQQRGMTTTIVGVLDPLTMTFTYAAAGHPGPIVATASGVETLPSGGLPLGFLHDAAPTWTVALPPGAMLVLYTDGLIEYGRDAVAGHGALVAAAGREAAAPSVNPARRILERVIEGAQPFDDIALVVLSLAGGPLDRLDVTLPAEPASLRLVRQAIQQLCTGLGLDEGRTLDLNVAVGEAVNNAVEHAYGVAPGIVRLRAHRADSRLTVEVEDSGRWRPARPNNPGGRGFTLMRALADDVQVMSGDEGTVVRLTVGLDGTRTAAGAAVTPHAERIPPLSRPEAARSEPAVAASLGRIAFDVRREGSVPVVTAAGEMDVGNVGQFVETMERVARDAQRLLILDLGRVSYFDSQGMRALLDARRRVAGSRREMVVVVPPDGRLRRLLDVAGLGTALPIFSSVAEALAGSPP